MSRKQKIYGICGTRKTLNVQVMQGEIIDLTSHQGIVVQIGLVYRRPYWFATHIESGLDCTPQPKSWKKKDELVDKLKELDWKRLLKDNPFQIYKDKIAEYKASEGDTDD